MTDHGGPLVRCSLCDERIEIGQHVHITAVEITDDGTPVLNYQHTACLDAQAAAFRRELDGA